MDLYQIIEKEISTIANESVQRSFAVALERIRTKNTLETIELMISLMRYFDHDRIQIGEEFLSEKVLHDARDIAVQELSALETKPSTLQ